MPSPAEIHVQGGKKHAKAKPQRSYISYPRPVDENEFKRDLFEKWPSQAGVQNVNSVVWC